MHPIYDVVNIAPAGSTLHL